MKASEIPLGAMIENPREVSYLVFSSIYIKDSFITSYGDVDVIYNEKYGYYAVPAFAEGRAAIREVWSSECAIWGSE